MTDITLPNETQVRAVDQDAFTWDDLMDGLITESHGAVFKLVVEQMDAGGILSINEQYAGTGKTAKFVLDNATNGADIKVITADIFTDAYLTTSEYFDNVGSAANAYKLDLSGRTRINLDEGGSPVSVDQLDLWGEDPTAVISNIVLANDPIVLGTNDLANKITDIPKNVIKNAADVALAESGNLKYDCVIYNPWPVSMGQAAHELNSMKETMASLFNNLNSGGAMVVTAFHLPAIQTAFWTTMNAMTNTGKLWTAEYVLNSEADNTGYWQTAIIRKS
jgi:hypothetical protein